VDVPTLPAIVMLDDKGTASVAIHVWSAGPVHETNNAGRGRDDRGHLVCHEVLTRMEPVRSPCPERICEMVGAVHREDKVVVDVLTHVDGKCSSGCQHHERNSGKPSDKKVFPSHEGDIGTQEEDIRQMT
jgi:hypothetical protein